MLYLREENILLPLAAIILISAKHPNVVKLFTDYILRRPRKGTISDSGVCLLFSCPGLEISLKEFLPTAEEIKAIPMNWDVEDATQTEIP